MNVHGASTDLDDEDDDEHESNYKALQSHFSFKFEPIFPNSDTKGVIEPEDDNRFSEEAHLLDVYEYCLALQS